MSKDRSQAEIIRDLERLDRLRQSGALTSAEFHVQKQRLLSGDVAEPAFLDEKETLAPPILLEATTSKAVGTLHQPATKKPFMDWRIGVTLACTLVFGRYALHAVAEERGSVIVGGEKLGATEASRFTDDMEALVEAYTLSSDSGQEGTIATVKTKTELGERVKALFVRLAEARKQIPDDELISFITDLSDPVLRASVSGRANLRKDLSAITNQYDDVSTKYREIRLEMARLFTSESGHFSAAEISLARTEERERLTEANFHSVMSLAGKLIALDDEAKPTVKDGRLMYSRKHYAKQKELSDALDLAWRKLANESP